MRSKELIIIPVHFTIADRDDFFHITDKGREALNYYQPYLYRTPSGSLQMARLQKNTNMDRFFQLIDQGLVYRVSKASLDDNIPVAEYVRKDKAS